jgi:Rrf2 family protein
MLFPIKVDYGVRLLIDLAQQPQGVPIPAGASAARQHVPEAFVVQILNTLQKAGMIESRRGPHGGHMLAKPAGEITVAEVVDTFERRLAPMECIHEPDECTLSNACSQRELWTDIERMLLDVLSRTSIADLARRQQTILAGATA